MNAEIVVCVLMAVCVVAPAVLVLIGLRYMYARRFQRNSRRHLSAQKLDEHAPPSSIYIADKNDHFYGSNITIGGLSLDDKKLSPAAKVREYIASIPSPQPAARTLSTLQIEQLEDEIFAWHSPPSKNNANTLYGGGNKL